MTSRRTRKRDRHLAQVAEATARAPKLKGGWGQGLPICRADLLLVRQAIRENWPTSTAARSAIVRDVATLALTTDSDRLMVAAVRVIISAEAHNQRLDIEARRSGAIRGNPDWDLDAPIGLPCPVT